MSIDANFSREELEAAIVCEPSLKPSESIGAGLILMGQGLVKLQAENERLVAALVAVAEAKMPGEARLIARKALATPTA